MRFDDRVYEITPPMLEAGWKILHNFELGYSDGDETLRLIYLAMLAANEKNGE